MTGHRIYKHPGEESSAAIILGRWAKLRVGIRENGDVWVMGSEEELVTFEEMLPSAVEYLREYREKICKAKSFEEYQAIKAQYE